MSNDLPRADTASSKVINGLPIIHSEYKYLEQIVLVLKRLSEGHDASKIANDYFENDLHLVSTWIEFAKDIGLIDNRNNNKLTEKGKKWKQDIEDSFWK
jgi:hypothetical protein